MIAVAPSFADHPAALSTSALSFVLPLDLGGHEKAETPRLRKRGASAALNAASAPAAGILAWAPPPGALGHRTLWAMLLGLFVARLLWSALSLALS